ncbi:hypothetical protein F4692_001239 [Nocardioides cavernae]|uniref:GAF domain-containing protein n=1 Tax=Nocardioides cavernae TaxID=1921566 RepID=A0A7Y9H1K4_9ACTN|nr:helix-turn-helix domain-containing protein [Nocardioides cavernae]NYE36135.1 hypothetical protein [Nocardioides cavernae]
MTGTTSERRLDLEREVLRGVADAVGSDPDLRVVCSRVAEAVRCGRTTRDVYVYLYEDASDDLLLVGATESPAAREVGTLRVPYGDGVTGWVAASRESYVVAGEPSSDPHFLPYPGIGEERYGAIFSVPVVSSADELVGCITVWATPGDGFAAHEVPLVEHVASLVATCLERERLREQVRVLGRTEEGLRELGELVASRAPVGRVVDRAAALALAGLGADLVVALVADPSGADRMVVALASGSDPERRAPAAAVRRGLLEVDHDLRRARITWQVAAERVTRALEGRSQPLATAAVRSGPDELGRIEAHVLGPGRRPTAPAGLLPAIAGQVGVATRLGIALEELADRNGLTWFLRAVTSGRLAGDDLRRRAEALGLDRAAAHVFVVACTSGRTASSAQLDTVLQRASLPAGTLTGATPHQAVAVVPWPSASTSVDALRRPLLRACDHVRSAGAALTVGVSRPAPSVDGFADALAEAREAMSVASSLPEPAGVFTLDDVGHHLLLSRVSGVAGVRDRYAVAVESIAEYDRVRGTELLGTVATYLHLRSRSAAARDLVVHRNTLAQRLTRASQLSGFDVSAPDAWFPLQLALQVHLARSGVPGGGSQDVRPLDD